MIFEKKQSFFYLLLLHLLFSSFCIRFCISIDTITSTDFIKDPATILSIRGNYELGFFSPVNSTGRYVGIWFKVSPQTVVWVANRDNPLNDTSGILTISKDGNLVVLDGRNTILWSSNVSKPAINSTARILDSGKLVLEDSASGLIFWESFKYPSDKLLPMMKLVTNTRTKEKVGIISWKSPSDPSTGNFTLTLDVSNISEAVVWNGHNPFWRSGPWNGRSFIGVPDMIDVYLRGFSLVVENQTYSLSVSNSNEDSFVYDSLDSQGNLVEMYWDFAEKEWRLSWFSLKTPCDFYGTCGSFGICNAEMSPICRCLRGFEPKKEEEWNRGNWKNGCVRKTPLQCEKTKNISSKQDKEDEFYKIETVKLPYLAQWSTFSTSADDCRLKCLDNCLCSAYASEKGIGCMLWNGSLIDIQQFDIGGADLYIRGAYPQSDDVKHKKGIIIALVTPGTLILIISIYILWSWMTKKKVGKRTQAMLFSNTRRKFLKLRNKNVNESADSNQVKLPEFPLYHFEKLAIATNNFDSSNKLGQGGFGPVYKGRLSNGQEIAIKRLSRTSNQGLEEFTNEVMVISKLQHRNLVRLFGCCVEGEEKMLIYEFMPNLSLDAFIFDSSKQKLLDWRKRFNIIDGIARGVLYLHRDSRLKIIHRDLKASNILLDNDFNPKISDFGMARVFGSNEAQANTMRVVGTYGYMSPEYAMQGQFSEKSDVFSLGVLLLEIISGRRNTSFYQHDQAISLLELAWKLWIEENVIQLIDPTIYELCHQLEILRCIQVGLLCVQEFVIDRPNVSTIISMLNSEIIDIPPPKQPAFIGRRFEIESYQQSSDNHSVNIVTITRISGR